MAEIHWGILVPGGKMKNRRETHVSPWEKMKKLFLNLSLRPSVLLEWNPEDSLWILTSRYRKTIVKKRVWSLQRGTSISKVTANYLADFNSLDEQ